MAKAGMCTLAFSKKPVSAALEIAARAGADGVEIWGQPDHVRYPPDEAQLQEVREQAESLALEICVFGSYYHCGTATSYGGVRLDARNQISIARALGASLIRIWPGTKNPEACTPREIQGIIDEIRLFADHASDAGIGVVLERHGNSLTNGWDGIEELLDRIGHPGVSLNYQIAHPATAQEYEERSVRDYTQLLPRSRHAHLQNYRAAADGTLKRCFLDSGLIDYGSLGAVAGACGYTGHFMVEFPAELNEGLGDVQTIRRDIDFIKSLA